MSQPNELTVEIDDHEAWLEQAKRLKKLCDVVNSPFKTNQHVLMRDAITVDMVEAHQELGWMEDSPHPYEEREDVFRTLFGLQWEMYVSIMLNPELKESYGMHLQ